MNFISKLIKITVNILLYIIVFVALVWALMGYSPSETVNRSIWHIKGVIKSFSSASGVVRSTASDMAHTAKYHLNEAADRIDGKDPYENYQPQ